MAKTSSKWPALESVFSELADAITRKKFTKARRLAGQIEFNVLMAWMRNDLALADREAYDARVREIASAIPAKPARPATKRQRQDALRQSMMTKSKSDFYTAS
jgi:hypothetical protein